MRQTTCVVKITSYFRQAYRLEPLILKHYANIQPAVIGNPRMLKDPDLPKCPPTGNIEGKFGFTDKKPPNLKVCSRK